MAEAAGRLKAARGLVAQWAQRCVEQGGQVVVDRLVDQGPGVRGGLQKGDIILGVDGEDVGGRGVQEAISNIRGEAGSTVWMKVKRGNEEMTIPIRREPIHLDGR